MTETDPKSGASSMSDTTYRVVVIGLCVLACVALIRLQFCPDIALPPKPPRPKLTAEKAQRVSTAMSRSREAYRERLVRDARKSGVRPATLEEMERAFPYEVDAPWVVLDPRKGPRKVTAAGLELSLSVEKVKGSYRKQMVLEITNPGDRPLAYRVKTRPTKGTRPCRRKRALPHDGVAVAAGATERRSECLYRRGWGLEIQKVETIALPALSYVYVSQLVPEKIGVPRRVARGHRPPTGTPCSLILPGDVARAITRGALEWRDAIDFYARHSCQNYTIPVSYRAFEHDGEQPLPVVPRGG
jgi:hypothetical protein